MLPPCPECNQGNKHPQSTCNECLGSGYPFDALTDERALAVKEVSKVLNGQGTVLVSGWLRAFGLVPDDAKIGPLTQFYLTRTNAWYRASDPFFTRRNAFDPSGPAPMGRAMPPATKMRLWLHELWVNGSFEGGIIGEIQPEGERYIQAKLFAARETILKTIEPFKRPSEVFDFIEL